VASFASWHEHHELAFAAVGRTDAVVAHCLLETFSVLTRLPAPHRMAADVVCEFLDQSFAARDVVALSGSDQQKLVASAASIGVTGGAIYDALIAATCANAGIKLLTLDSRARQTYATLGVAHELLS
jgi:predicted nucleic acid-binding protein